MSYPHEPMGTFSRFANTDVRRSATAGTKTRFVGNDGSGRDSYIFQDNGGFYPASTACTIEDQGKINC